MAAWLAVRNCSGRRCRHQIVDSELMNTQLIADAVRNSRSDDQSTVWDRLFAFWFRRLVYTQIWEDPEADLAALQLPVGSTIVTISSGGCNALSYLTAQPAQVFAVDLNEAHLSLLKLKLAGLRAFSKYVDFWQFFGEAASPANSELYRDHLWLWLDADACAYWDKRNLVGRPRHAYFTDGFYRHGMLGRFIGHAHRLAKLARIDLKALLTGKVDSPRAASGAGCLHRLFHSRPNCHWHAGAAVQPGHSAAAARTAGSRRAAP
jgi:S-adenosylmethionine-diacylglycerol 3-amino-3-carboxypropyl transferase